MHIGTHQVKSKTQGLAYVVQAVAEATSIVWIVGDTYYISKLVYYGIALFSSEHLMAWIAISLNSPVHVFLL